MNQQDWAKIRLLALDFDGVMTNGTVIVGTDGVESVVCNHRDGQGIDLLKKQRGEIPIVVISSQRSSYVDPRCNKMKIPFFRPFSGQGKLAKLREFIDATCPTIGLEEVCFVGDDSSDLEVMKAVGFPVSVANGTDEVKAIARHVTKRSGGDGAVREVCDLILEAKRQKTSGRSGKMILITGTGEQTTPETATAVEETAYRLAMAGHTILTNSGRNGVPEAAAEGVKRARGDGGVGQSIAYAYLPDLTIEICGTNGIRHFDSFEVRNGSICRDAEVAVFFQGGFGSMTKFFLLIQRVAHINDLLRNRDLIGLVRPKQIILHHSFAKTREALTEMMGSTWAYRHFEFVRIIETPAGIASAIN